MAKKKNYFAEVAGWYGTAAILLAYILVSFDVLGSKGVAFQLLNLTGALGIIVISVYKNVKQGVVLNMFWFSVALVALARLLIG